MSNNFIKMEDIKEKKDKLPYTFIPNIDNDLEYVEPAKFNKTSKTNEELFSGHLDCSMYALNHMIVGNEHKTFNKGENNEYTEISPLEVKDKILISPYSIKGMLSSFLKSYLDIPIKKLNEEYFFMRPGSNIYNKVSNNSHQKRFILGAGIIDKITETEIDVNVIEGILSFGDTQKNDNIKINPFNVKANMLEKSRVKVNDVFSLYCFFSYPDGWDNTGISVEKFLNNIKEDNGKTKTKHHNCVGFAFNKYESAIRTKKIKKIKKDVINTFHKTLDKLANHHTLNHPLHYTKDETKQIQKALKSMKNLQIGQPVFFEYDIEKQEIISFGTHFYYLWLYENSLQNLQIPFNQKIRNEIIENDGVRNLSLHKEIFGYTDKDLTKDECLVLDSDKIKAKSGKIHINYALYQGGGETCQKVNKLNRPGEPKPSAYEFYLKQDFKITGKINLKTYGDIAKNDTNKSQISGRKQYRKTLNQSFICNDEKMSIRLIKVLKITKGSNMFPKFKFKISFENLSKQELSLLCFAVQLNNDKQEYLSQNYNSGSYLCHQIGYGKNYGMGAVKLFIDNLTAYDDKLNKHTFDIDKLINQNNLDNIPELKNSLALTDKSFSYPGKEWHKDVRENHFKNRRGNSDKKSIWKQ